MQPGIGLIGSRSTPIIKQEEAAFFEATYIQPPGAAQRSTMTIASSKKWYFLLS